MSYSRTIRLEIEDAHWQMLRCHLETPSSTDLALLVILLTGCRAEEALSVTRDCVGPDTLRIRGMKGSLDRNFPLPQNLLARLRVELHSGDLGQRVGAWHGSRANKRIALHHRFKVVCCKLLGHDSYTLHSMRHTMAIRSFERGFDLMQVAALLGHISVSSTEKYLRIYKSRQTQLNIGATWEKI